MKTISLELAKKLKKVADENGINLLEQFLPKYIWKKITKDENWILNLREDNFASFGFAPAYTTDELLEILPNNTSLYKLNPDGSYTDEVVKYSANLAVNNNGTKETHDPCEHCDNPCEALGKLYEYLIANKLIK